MAKIRELRACSRTTRVSIPDARVQTPQQVYELSKILLNRNEGFPPGEVFLILFTDAQHNLRTYATFPGGCSLATVDSCQIARLAVLSESVGAVVVHNHPSNAVSPSAEDILMTKRLKRTFEALDMILRDHIIVTRDDFYSLREAGHYRP